ncbi:Uncharacterised protein [Serratia fonticola]|uniref:Uncharacterized protein n=1 Tax=Serratia fonticola TaxID=47917 RepID=A0A4U9VY96_SERFO|nr:Uncharacterised protein [Serratia fonticola]
MTCQGQGQIGFGNAAAIITDADQFGPTAFDININPRCPGIQTIFYQFLHYRRRPFDHFSGGNLVG